MYCSLSLDTFPAFTGWGIPHTQVPFITYGTNDYQSIRTTNVSLASYVASSLERTQRPWRESLGQVDIIVTDVLHMHGILMS